MHTSESLTGTLEGFKETSCESSEFICSTEVCGFESCEVINNKQLTNYLQETIPVSHFEGCPSIELDRNYSGWGRSE